MLNLHIERKKEGVRKTHRVKERVEGCRRNSTVCITARITKK